MTGLLYQLLPLSLIWHHPPQTMFDYCYVYAFAFTYKVLEETIWLLCDASSTLREHPFTDLTRTYLASISFLKLNKILFKWNHISRSDWKILSLCKHLSLLTLCCVCSKAIGILTKTNYSIYFFPLNLQVLSPSESSASWITLQTTQIDKPLSMSYLTSKRVRSSMIIYFQSGSTPLALISKPLGIYESSLTCTQETPRFKMQISFFPHESFMSLHLVLHISTP